MPATATDRLSGLTTSVAVKPAVKAVTTANITLSGLVQSTLVLATGAALAEGMRVLVKDQDDQTENGIYLASTSDWTRALDFDGARDVVDGTLIVFPISLGNGALYQVDCSDDPPIIGTSAIRFSLRDNPNITYPINGTEVTALITPKNTGYQPLIVQRYMSASQLSDYLAGTALVDQTSAFSAAESVAFAGGGGKIYAPAGKYLVQGTITLRSGVILIGDGSSGSEYFPDSPYNTVQVTQLWKKSTGTTGSIVIVQTASQLRGLYFRYDLLGGSANGVVQVGTASHSVIADNVYNLDLSDLSFYGPAISGSTLVDNTCAALYFMDGDATVGVDVQRYGNKGNNLRFSNFVTGIRLGENCNANVFTGLNFRNVYLPIVLNGGTNQSCVENVFDGFTAFNIGGWPSGINPFVFSLSNSANYNTFSGYTTENASTAFEIDATCFGNRFLGIENEVTPSYVPPGPQQPWNVHALWGQPDNRSQYSSMLIPNVSTPLAYTNGQGAKLSFVRAISGTLPQLNGSGTLVAADANSKVFARFNSTLYAKSAQPTFRARLIVSLNAPGSGVGESLVEVEFWYRPTDNSTHAASLSVISVSKKPSSNYIAGLKFLTGVASGLGMGLAIVGGNVGAVVATHLIVELELLVFTFSTNSVSMGNYSDISWGCNAATANDVTDAIDLLTVADTSVT